LYNLQKLPEIAKNLDTFERDCSITVALKIADDSCKMDEYEKSVFMALFDSLEGRESSFFVSDVFDIINLGRDTPSAKVYADIKKLREAAMDMITRPKMKAFKASIRERILD
jgi:hypothetical protein